MPLYDYECQKCSCRFEVTRSISELNDPNPICIQCGSRKTARKLGNVVVFTRSKQKHGITAGRISCGSCSSRSRPSCSGCGNR